MSLTPQQCRMARGALNWSGRDLARAAGLAYNTVSAFERGRYQLREKSLAQIQEVFEKHNLRFRATSRNVTVELWI
jgi:transcriptional regulator with XRE-family HTH domain